MINTHNISKIGFGTWGIGGFAEPDPTNDDRKDIEGVRHWLELGANYMEIPLFYARGKSAALVAQSIKESGIPREDLFIALTVHHHREPNPTAIYSHLHQFFELFQTDYADSIQFSMGALTQWGNKETLTIVDDVLAKDMVKLVNSTNANVELLRQLHSHFGDRLFGHEVHFNFEIRANEDEGVIQYADKMGIKNIIAQPLRRNNTVRSNWPLLVEMAAKQNATQNQIILAWMLHRGMLPIPKSTNVAHIDEIWNAQHISLSAVEIKALNEWRPPNYTSPKIDWLRTQDPQNGVAIDQLSNVFDEDYSSQTNTRPA